MLFRSARRPADFGALDLRIFAQPEVEPTLILRRIPVAAADFLEYSGKRELPPMHTADQSGRIVSHYLDGED